MSYFVWAATVALVGVWSNNRCRIACFVLRLIRRNITIRIHAWSAMRYLAAPTFFVLAIRSLRLWGHAIKERVPVKIQKLLVVEHDVKTRQEIDEILGTMNLKYDFAASLAEAREALNNNSYSCILLDYAVPCRPGSNPRMQNSMHFFDFINRTIKVGRRPPVAVIVERLPDVDEEDKFRWAADMRSRGATTFICRPFRAGGRTLDRVVEKLLAGQSEGVRLSATPAISPKEAEDPVPAQADPPAASGDTAPTPQATPEPAAPTDGRWASVPNEPIEIDDFLAKFCEQRTKENRVHRKRALLGAARHGTVALPPLAVQRKHGQANTYFVHTLLAAWQGYLDEGVDLPPLLTEYGSGANKT